MKLETDMNDIKTTIAFQGELGANSHMACIEARPNFDVLPCHSFEDMLAAVQEKRAIEAMVPVSYTHLTLPTTPYV